MSTSDRPTPSGGRCASATRRRARREALPRFETPIVPQATIAGRALVAVVAIMTFLASLTTGAVMLVRARGERMAVGGRARGHDPGPPRGRPRHRGRRRQGRRDRARGVPGVAEVRPYSKEEAARLLEPWLGTGLCSSTICRCRASSWCGSRPARRPISRNCARRSAEQVPAASLDDHRGFVDRMRAMASAAVVGGIGVLALVLVATVLSVTFATRGAMATNRPVIEVLHFIGAKDSFIAGHFQRHFLQLGLKGGVIGGGGAMVLFALAELASGWFAGAAAGDQFAALFGTFSIGVLGYLAVLAQVGLIAVVTAATSRRTVNRTIETIH